MNVLQKEEREKQMSEEIKGGMIYGINEEPTQEDAIKKTQESYNKSLLVLEKAIKDKWPVLFNTFKAAIIKYVGSNVIGTNGTSILFGKVIGSLIAGTMLAGAPDEAGVEMERQAHFNFCQSLSSTLIAFFEKRNELVKVGAKSEDIQ